MNIKPRYKVLKDFSTSMTIIRHFDGIPGARVIFIRKGTKLDWNLEMGAYRLNYNPPIYINENEVICNKEYFELIDEDNE